jgi:hypothetical protein
VVAGTISSRLARSIPTASVTRPQRSTAAASMPKDSSVVAPSSSGEVLSSVEHGE